MTLTKEPVDFFPVLFFIINTVGFFFFFFRLYPAAAAFKGTKLLSIFKPTLLWVRRAIIYEPAIVIIGSPAPESRPPANMRFASLADDSRTHVY